jgi:hypothetical protein
MKRRWSLSILGLRSSILNDKTAKWFQGLKVLSLSLGVTLSHIGLPMGWRWSLLILGSKGQVKHNGLWIGKCYKVLSFSLRVTVSFIWTTNETKMVSIKFGVKQRPSALYIHVGQWFLGSIIFTLHLPWNKGS